MSEKAPVLIPIPLGIVKTFLIRGERPILVDAGNPRDERRILAAISQHGIDPEDLSLILITHSHSDHAGSVYALKERTRAPVAVHRSDADALRRGSSADLCPTGIVGRLFKLLVSRAITYQGTEPDILIDAELDLTEYGVNGKAIHTPGHTSGSVSVTLAGSQVIVGDLLIGSFVRQGVPNYPFFVNDMSQIRDSIKRILELEPTKIHTSHGGPFDPEIVLTRFKSEIS